MSIKKIRAVLSTLLIICMVVICSTGAVLYFMKTGMIGPFSRIFLLNAHALTSVVMIVVVALHLTVNRRMYKDEMKALMSSRKEKAEAEE